MLKKLLAGLGKRPEGQTGITPAEPVDHKGFRIIACPEPQNGQFRVSGLIQQPLADGSVREYRFDRSDMLPAREACDAMMVSKARRFIDETGDAMFGTEAQGATTDGESEGQ